MNPYDLLPIKVVFPKQDDYHAPHPPRPSTTEFVPVDDALRRTLSHQIEDVKDYFQQSFRSSGAIPAVARVKLRSEAIAKTYRPTELFTPDSCPIIGASKFGELFVSVKPSGLAGLENKIKTGDTKKLKANISTIELIAPYTLQDALAGQTIEAVQEAVMESGRALKIRLFRHQTEAENQAIDYAFQSLAKASGIRHVELLNYASGLRVYRVVDSSPQRIADLAGFVGIQSLSAFPSFRVVKTASRILENVTSVHFPPPEPGREYPLVGLIDTGTDPTNPFLQAWVAARYERVPKNLQDNGHGSFVAGLLVHGRRLNHGHEGFPSVSSRIVDVVAIDSKGKITEDQLIFILDA